MYTIQLSDFMSDVSRWMDLGKSKPLVINDQSSGWSFSLKRTKQKENLATPEELEAYREAMEERARGEYDYRREGETTKEFFDRILSCIE